MKGGRKGEGGKFMKRQSDTNITKQVRIDKGLHRLLKIKAARSGITIRELLEGCLVELLEVDNNEE